MCRVDLVEQIDSAAPSAALRSAKRDVQAAPQNYAPRGELPVLAEITTVFSKYELYAQI